MHIVGGTYIERVLDHNWQELFGSGLRACCVLPRSTNINYYTYIGPDYLNALEYKTTEFKINLTQKVVIPKTISFQYLTSLSEPLIVDLPLNVKEVIEIKSEEAVLRYGMMERDAICHGNRVVYDPQSPNRPQPYYANGSTAKELAVIMNHQEASLLSGGDNPNKLFENESTKIIIIKNGPQGALLYHRSGNILSIPSYMTETVFSVGSGDVFSAFFTYFWAEKGEDPCDSALKASKAVALYVSSNGALSQIDESLIEGFNEPLVPANIKSIEKKIYLAGPFFTLSDRWFVEEALRHFTAMEISVFSPFHDIGIGCAEKVYSADIEGLKSCDVIFANLCGLDVGTIYEIGYARACGKPVVVFIQNYKKENLTMVIGGDCKIFEDYTSAVYNAVWEALKT